MKREVEVLVDFLKNRGYFEKYERNFRAAQARFIGSVFEGLSAAKKKKALVFLADKDSNALVERLDEWFEDAEPNLYISTPFAWNTVPESKDFWAEVKLEWDKFLQQEENEKLIKS
jgi:hypothetical protein